MRHQAFLNATFFIYTASVSTLEHEHFELDGSFNGRKQIDYLATMLCSIDMKFVSIHFELESEGRLLDRIIAETTSCVPPSITITAHKKDGYNVRPSKGSGARLIILLVRELELESPMFPILFQIRQKHKFNLFYMIVSEVKISADHESILILMYRNYNLLNAVVVAMENDSSDPIVITYNPFNNTTVRIPNNVYKRSELFIKKNSNIFGSPLNILMYKDLVSTLTCRQTLKMFNSNYDAFLPDLISSSMNATLVLRTPYTNDSRIEDVMAVDLTINGRSYPIDTNLGAGVEETIMVRRDDICILLPYNRNRSPFGIIFGTVEPFVWMLMITVMVQAWITLFIIRRVQPRFHGGKKWRPVFLFNLFGLHVNQGLTLMPKNVPPRLIIASCLIYCLVIKSIFEGLLYNSVAKHQSPRLSTIDELLDSNELELLVNDIFYNFSGNFLNKSPIQNRFKVISFLEYVGRIDSNEMHSAYVGRKSGSKFLESVHMMEGLPVYYTMDECIVPFMTSYLVRQGSMFLDRINHILRISDESGLFSYWENQLRNVYDKVKQIDQRFGRHSALNLEHIGFIFQTWIYGLAIATVIFVTECLLHLFRASIWYRKLTISTTVARDFWLKRSRLLSR